MAEEFDLSRTEPASPRRLQQARSEGDVPRSAELTAWVVLLSALAALAWWAPQLFAALTLQFQTALQSVAQPFPAEPFAPWVSIATMLLPLLAFIFIALLLAPMLLSGWVFAPRALDFKSQRLNPFRPFKLLFSLDGLFVIGKTLLKFALVIGVCWLTLSGEWTHLWALPIGSVVEASRAAASLLLQGLLAVVATLAVIAVVDAGWQWWRYRAGHGMTWQEVLAEAKESEGSPEMRGRMLGRQQAAVAQSLARPLPSPDETTSHSTDETSSHSTRLSKNDNQVAGYKPASGQVAGYLPFAGEGANARPEATT